MSSINDELEKMRTHLAMEKAKCEKSADTNRSLKKILDEYDWDNMRHADGPRRRSCR